jgi:predicted ribonuclease YlaK
MTPPTAGTSPTDAHADDGIGVKHFVLDTNVLLHNPNALFVFQDNHVVIPYPVIEELDKMKRRDDDIGRNARAVIRHLDRLRAGQAHRRRELGRARTRSRTRVRPRARRHDRHVRIDTSSTKSPPVIAEDEPDNRIIAVAHELQERGEPAVFVSKDLRRASRATRSGSRPKTSRTRRSTPTGCTRGTPSSHAAGGDRRALRRPHAADRDATSRGRRFTLERRRPSRAEHQRVRRDARRRGPEPTRGSGAGWRTPTT